MSDLRPLLESSPNSATRALLRAGLPDNPAPGAHQRVAVALGIGAAASAVASTAAAGGASAAGVAGLSTSGTAKLGLGLLATKWLVGGLMAGGLVAGGAVLAEKRAAAPLEPTSSAPETAAFSGPASHLQRRQSASPATPDTPFEAPAPADERIPSRLPTPSGGAVPPTIARRPGAPAALASPRRQTAPPEALPSVAELPAEQGRLGREVGLIDAARRSVAAGDANGAMAELDRYDGVSETRIMDREARLLRIDALVLNGQRERAAELAREYLRRFPNDPHSVRLRKLIAPE